MTIALWAAAATGCGGVAAGLAAAARGARTRPVRSQVKWSLDFL